MRQARANRSLAAINRNASLIGIEIDGPIAVAERGAESVLMRDPCGLVVGLIVGEGLPAIEAFIAGERFTCCTTAYPSRRSLAFVELGLADGYAASQAGVVFEARQALVRAA